MQAQIKIPVPTQRRVLKVGKEMSSVHQHRETCGNGQGSKVSESAGRICHQHRETCGNCMPRMFRKSRNSRRFRRFNSKPKSRIWPHHFHISPEEKASSLLCDRAVRILKSQTYVFSDLVLCLGGISPEPVHAWKDTIHWYLETRYLKELDRIDGESMEFVQTFPRILYIGNFTEIQRVMAELGCEPEQFQGRIIFMYMFNDITWGTPGNVETCAANSSNFVTHAKRFPFGCWSYLGPGCEKRGVELTSTSQMAIGIELLRS